MIANLVDFRIALTIAADVGQTVRLLWIRPEVWRLAHVIMLIAARGSCSFCNDGKRAAAERLLCFPLEFHECSRVLLVSRNNALSGFSKSSRVENEDPWFSRRLSRNAQADQDYEKDSCG